MMFTSTRASLTAALFAVLHQASAAPIQDRSTIGDVISSDPVQVTYTDAVNKVKSYYDSVVNANTGTEINDWFGTENILYSTIGKPAVDQIDVLADRLCVGQPDQGSLCGETFAYVYAVIIANENTMTFGAFANLIGTNGVQAFNSDIQQLCLGSEDDGGLCQDVSSNLDNLANAVVGATDAAENDGNSNSYQLLGLDKILPAPTGFIILP